MKNTYLAFKLAIVSFLLSTQIIFAAGIDMQSHVASDAGKAAYTTYVTKQTAYYKTGYTYTELMSKTGSTLFGALNQLMGETNKIAASRYSYGNLRDMYIWVDKDLNNASNIISYYNGASMSGKWDSGKLGTANTHGHNQNLKEPKQLMEHLFQSDMICSRYVLQVLPSTQIVVIPLMEKVVVIMTRM